MIAGQFFEGSGLGNQLHRYVATRCLALDHGYEFGMINPNLFKGKSFMNLDLGIDATNTDFWIPDNYFHEKKITENGIDIRSYDPEVNFISDDTIIDGEFQDERYWQHHADEVREWLKVDPINNIVDDTCVINFRGGEYTMFPDLFLTQEYWRVAIGIMLQANPNMKFEVHTDDTETARKFFRDFPIIQDMGINWRSIRYAKYLILSNSSFAILPAWLNQDVKLIIAPRFWARRNIGVWAQPANFYKGWLYI